MFRLRLSLFLSVVLASLIASVTLAADFQDSRFNLTPMAGWTFFDRELKAPIGPFNNDLYLGGRLGMRVVSPVWLELAGGYTKTEACDCEPSWTHLSANLLLASSSPRAIQPFVSLGGGVSKIVPQFGPDRTNTTFEAAAGVKVKMSDALGLRLEARNVLILPKKDYGKAHLDNVAVGAGLVFAFGGDRSEPIAAVVEPPVAAPVVVADSDGDGVNDNLDRCPGTPAGCRVDANGCPIDSDGDGVCDGLDQCADTPAGTRVDKNGCPISQREVELLDTGRIRLTNVEFDYDRSTIRPFAHSVLDSVGALLTKWPGLEIEVQGHTDSRGSDEYNLALSHRRAESVRNWLQEKFPQFAPAQLSAKGFGESVPLESNGSSGGMQSNRRVEFVVLNKEILKGK